jgi:RNA polymerase sigma-54 factor
MQATLSINLSQKVAMTPQLAESIRFLQLSASELAEELQAALDENVMLELEDENACAEDTVWADASLQANDQWTSSAAQPTGQSFGDDYNFEDRLVEDEQPVHLRILQQAQMLYPDEHRLRIAMTIIDSTDDNGYLSVSLGDILSRLGKIDQVTSREVETVLHSVQRLEPVGFAARSLSECLLIQLDELPVQTPGRETAMAIVADHLEALGRMAVDELVDGLGETEASIAQAIRLIRSLSPKPAEDERMATVVIPDVQVYASDVGQGGGWAVRLNNAAFPSLRINAEYEGIVCKEAQAKSLRGQLQEARWLLRSIEMRNDTLLRATIYIFECQQDFLARGEIALRPLTLKSVADAIGVHESTISRITTSKYVQTPHGVYSLKAFFPSQLVAAQGVAASGAAVKAMIQKLILKESSSDPLRDVDLAAILARRGVKIARRTVAKYREALGIVSSKDRVEKYRLQSIMQRQIYTAPLPRLAGLARSST